MADRDAEIDDLIARRDIYDVLTRYSRALDRADVELMKTVYWPDGIDNHGVFNGNAAEFAEFIVREIQNWFEVTMHGLMNVHMGIKADVACTETYLFAYHKIRAEGRKHLWFALYADVRFDQARSNQSPLLFRWALSRQARTTRQRVADRAKSSIRACSPRSNPVGCAARPTWCSPTGRDQPCSIRISPSCATEATRSPERVNTVARASVRAEAATGLSITQSSQSSTRNGA